MGVRARAPAWGPAGQSSAEIKGRGGRAQSDPCLEDHRRYEDGPRTPATEARTLGSGCSAGLRERRLQPSESGPVGLTGGISPGGRAMRP